MKKILTPLCLSAAILILCSSCKKDHDTTPAVASCLLSEERWYSPGEYNINIDWQYEFDSNNHLVKATGFTQEGTYKSSMTVSGNVITIERDIYKQVDTYAGDLWGGTPDSLTAVITSSNANYSRTYKFTYNSRKQLIRVREKNSTADGLTAYLTYDAKGNLQQLAQYYDANPGIPYYLSNYTDYDDHPSGHAPLPYWKFLQHNENILSFATASWASTVSGHNAGKVRTITYSSQDKTYDAYQITYAYSYDERSRPAFYAETFQRDGQLAQVSWQVYFLYPCH